MISGMAKYPIFCEGFLYRLHYLYLQGDEESLSSHRFGRILRKEPHEDIVSDHQIGGAMMQKVSL